GKARGRAVALRKLAPVRWKTTAIEISLCGFFCPVPKTKHGVDIPTTRRPDSRASLKQRDPSVGEPVLYEGSAA
ncbi:hypothetical protein B8W95_13375, partial [Staphylococcus pasteuri]